MFYKKEFWFAIFFFVCLVVSVISLLNNGFATYRVCIIGLSAFFGILYIKQALEK